MKKLFVLAVALAMLCICFNGCRTKKDNDPTEGQTEPSSVLSSDPTDASTGPSTGVTLPEDTGLQDATDPSQPSTNSTVPSGNNQNNGNGQGNSGGNQNGGSSAGNSGNNNAPTDPTTPPTTAAPAPPVTTDPIPETSEPKENETEPTEDEEGSIELPVVPFPSNS